MCVCARAVFVCVASVCACLRCSCWDAAVYMFTVYAAYITKHTNERTHTERGPTVGGMGAWGGCVYYVGAWVGNGVAWRDCKDKTYRYNLR